MTWDIEALLNLLNRQSGFLRRVPFNPDPGMTNNSMVDSITSNFRGDPGMLRKNFNPPTVDENMARREQNAYEGLGLIDNMTHGNMANGPSDYLNRAESIMFRANQINQKAALARMRNSIPNVNYSDLPKMGHAGMSVGGGGGARVSTSSHNGGLSALMSAIRGKESGGNYGVVNRSSGALGAFQVMPGNVPSWSREALGYSVSPQKFLSSRGLQNRVVRHKLAQYYKKYGAAGAASAWYSGSPTRWKTSYGSQGAYPSVHNYVLDILKALNR